MRSGSQSAGQSSMQDKKTPRCASSRHKLGMAEARNVTGSRSRSGFALLRAFQAESRSVVSIQKIQASSLGPPALAKNAATAGSVVKSIKRVGMP